MHAMELERMNTAGLTNVVTLGFRTMLEGRRVEITERAEFGGQLYLTLFSYESAARAENMRLQRLFSCDEANYVIVSQPLSVEEENPQPTVMVLRVLSPDILGVISTAEFQHILPGAIVAWAGTSSPTTDDVLPILGCFAPVDI